MNQDNASKQDNTSENSPELTEEQHLQTDDKASQATEAELVDEQDAESNEFEGLDYKAYADELDAKLTKAEEIINGQKDAVLRAKADSENAKRRAELEIDKARKFALERFAGELLPVVDNLERAIQATDPDNEVLKPLLEGVEMTQKSLVSTLEKFDIKVINPEGETFNPDHHQAMSMQETNDVPANTVIAVMQKGYLINERLLRPAMVMVSRGGANANKVDTKA